MFGPRTLPRQCFTFLRWFAIGVLDDDLLCLAEQMAQSLVDDQGGVTVLAPVVAVLAEQSCGLTVAVSHRHGARRKASPLDSSNDDAVMVTRQPHGALFGRGLERRFVRERSPGVDDELPPVNMSALPVAFVQAAQPVGACARRAVLAPRSQGHAERKPHITAVPSLRL